MYYILYNESCGGIHQRRERGKEEIILVAYGEKQIRECTQMYQKHIQWNTKRPKKGTEQESKRLEAWMVNLAKLLTTN